MALHHQTRPPPRGTSPPAEPPPCPAASAFPRAGSPPFRRPAPPRSGCVRREGPFDPPWRARSGSSASPAAPTDRAPTSAHQAPSPPGRVTAPVRVPLSDASRESTFGCFVPWARRACRPVARQGAHCRAASYSSPASAGRCRCGCRRAPGLPASSRPCAALQRCHAWRRSPSPQRARTSGAGGRGASGSPSFCRHRSDPGSPARRRPALPA